jgi:hypothetical protein
MLARTVSRTLAVYHEILGPDETAAIRQA